MRLRHAPLLVLGLALVAVPPGCASQKESERDEPTKREAQTLRRTVTEFHKALRWGQYEKASEIVATARRERFLGRFEERGDEFDIVDLRIKNLSPEDRKTIRVEVQQKSVGADMTVDEERYVEIWRLDGNAWKLQRRLEKSEWRDRRTDDES